MIIRKREVSDFTSSVWSGGKTTELLLFPQSALYEKRNFDYRISSAVIEAEQSVFTELPDYERQLMVIDGEVKLTHKEGANSQTYSLAPFAKTIFSGGIPTVSEGRCTDFNVMYRKDYQVEMQPICDGMRGILKKGETCFLYSCTEKLTVLLQEETFLLEQGAGLLVADISEDQPFTLNIAAKNLHYGGILTIIQKVS